MTKKNYCNFWAFAFLLCFLLVVLPRLVLPLFSLLLLLRIIYLFICFSITVVQTYAKLMMIMRIS